MSPSRPRPKEHRPGESDGAQSRIRQTSGRLWIRLGGVYLLLAILVGVLSGLGFFTFGYGEGASYFSNDPTACANCHIMQDHFDSWQKSSHHAAATCNDCHLSPHPVGKWITKADNGFFHSLAFTTKRYPDPLRIKPRNREVTQAACLKCHEKFVHNMLPVHERGDMLNCVHCHTSVGHAER